MVNINIKDVSKSFGDKKVLNNISFHISDGDKIGLIGRNGVGKSTLFKIIQGIEKQDEGNIFISNNSIGYLTQIPVFKDKTGREVLLEAFDEVIKVSNNLRSLENRMQDPNEDLDALMKKYSNEMEKFERLDGYSIETKIDKVVSGLKIDERLLIQQFDSLSGGEKTKIILAKLLLEEPSVLLLDEPTNHLDIESLEWLEKYLVNFKGSIVIVSHDRYFLDKTVNKIIELTPEGVEEYLGNYSFYVLEKEKRYLSRLKSYLTQQNKIDRMQEQVDRFLASNSEGLHKKAHEIERRIERIEKLDKPIYQRKNMNFVLESSNRSGNRVLEIDDLSFGYDNDLLNDVNCEILYKDSIGIIGKNGCGKSTLLKLILGELNSQLGDIKTGTNLNIGYLDQNSMFPNENETLLNYYQRENGLTLQQSRNSLAKMLFAGDDVFKKLKNLSGGERSRVKLAVIMSKKPNFLILDEPTNHLDLNSREVLENQLIDYEGTLLFVSHDRYFLNRLATKIWSIDNHSLKEYAGNYDDYLEDKEKVKVMKK